MQSHESVCLNRIPKVPPACCSMQLKWSVQALHGLYALQQVGTLPSHQVRLNLAAQADLLWWHLFVEEWNGVALAWNLRCCTPDVTVFSDASVLWGCGAYTDSNWFQLHWSRNSLWLLRN